MKRRRRHSDVRQLSSEQRSELAGGMALLLEPGRETFFDSEQHARAAWEAHRDEIFSEWETPGRRPRGWWRFEAGEDPPSPSTEIDRNEYPWPWGAEAVRLDELGELTDEEREHLNRLRN